MSDLPAGPPAQGRRTGTATRGGWVPLAGVVAVATVLRPSVVAVGPVLPALRADLALGAGAVAVLTALPVVCFGLAAFAGPAAARRLGLDGALGAAVALVVVGGLVRVLSGPVLLFAGTVAAAAGIAVANVLLPPLIKRDFPTRVGPVTSLYTAALASAATLAALSAVPLARATGGGWRGPLTTWAAAAALALGLWLLRSRHGRARRAAAGSGAPAGAAEGRRPQPAGPAATGSQRRRVLLSLTAFMGLQSVGFYTIVNWLPTLLQDGGVSPTAAGALLSVAIVLGIPASLVVPVWASRLAEQRWLALGTAVVTAAGWVGLLLAPAAAPLLWVLLLGIGTGSAFPLALVMVALRSSTAEVTRRTSTTVQGWGYLIAACGPLLVGLLHQAVGGWRAPLALLLALAAGQGVSGWSAGRAATL